MNCRIPALLVVPLLLVGSAYASPPTPSYAVLSLVGDKIDIVTYQPQVGSQLDSNSHMPLPMSEDELDTVALRAVNRALHASAPGARVALLAASTADIFANQGRMFSGSHVMLPDEIDAAVHREGSTTLVLITKHHGEARLQVADGYIGSGKIEGLGFYVDTNKRMKVRETGVRSVGFLAPFVYVDVWLIDVATGTVTRRAAITSGHTNGASNNPEGVSPWDAISAQEKVAMLKRMLAQELAAVVPALVADTQEQLANEASSLPRRP
jgi:hypothetical protein